MTKALATTGKTKSGKLAVRVDDIAAAIERFIAAQDVKPSSRQTYRRALRPFFFWWKTSGVREPTRDDILAYKRHLEAQKLSSLTLSTYLVVVRKFFEWAEAMKLYPNVARGVKGARRARGFRKDPLTIAQIKDLLSVVDRKTLQGKRDFALLNLLIRTGLRTIEVIRADVADIRQQSGEAVLWVQGKGRDSKDEFVVLTPETLKPIHEYLASRGKPTGDDPLFTSLSRRNRGERLTTRTIRQVVKDSLKDIGIESERLSAHSLRHTAITLALQAGASIQEAQALGRHASIEVTMIYAHNLDRVGKAPEKKIAALLRSEGPGAKTA